MGLFTKKKQVVLVVEGIKCEHCVARIKDALKKNKVSSEINKEEKLVKVSFNESKISVEQIKTIIEDLGFKVI